jgi:hypothetical protein
MQVVPAICIYCKHFDRNPDGETLACAAFPMGVPVNILHSKRDHRLPYDGDNGVQFEVQSGKQQELVKLISLIQFAP